MTGRRLPIPCWNPRIMDWIRDYYGVDYKPNTRETIRRFTLHQFVIAELVEENADQPDRPINSPKWNYRITKDTLNMLRHRGRSNFELILKEFLEHHESYQSLAEERKNMPKTPVTLPSGAALNLSPSGSLFNQGNGRGNAASLCSRMPSCLYRRYRSQAWCHRSCIVR